MMLKLSFTLAAALYAGFVIWGQPGEEFSDTTMASAAPMVASGTEYAQPVILTNASTPDAEPVVTRAMTTDIVPDAAVIAASAPDPSETYSEPRLIGEPVVVSLVAPEAPAPVAERESQSTDGLLRVTGTRVNMRSGPSTSNAVVDSLVQGTLAEPVGEVVNGWVEIRDVATGQTGFMAARFLDPA